MAHKQLEDGRFVIDWETGDPEGDRRYLMQAYHDFIKELICEIEKPGFLKIPDVSSIIEKWQISVEDQVDDFPRIWIKRPLPKVNEAKKLTNE